MDIRLELLQETGYVAEWLELNEALNWKIKQIDNSCITREEKIQIMDDLVVQTKYKESLAAKINMLRVVDYCIS